ncbi:hypothetical protein PENNAL_c0208G09362 [Penicillium nalgiovense]|uniref:Integrase catalytic domain-containing protein n=1 Tax=Penicillium nalgiovense TaxID=60175 RepID=A0A1V6WRI3_PENNA|nr:hypothetical protein PENNAL_c0208G09362 [Penicillium nalgiovense]
MADFDEEDNAGESSARSLSATRQQQQSQNPQATRAQVPAQTEQQQPTSYVRRPRTQATNLPEEKEIKLNKGIKLLLDGSNLARWKRQIENGLSMVRIDKVANYKLPRPEETDPDYDIWEYWSKIACGWIESLLDQEIITILEGGVEAFPRRADDMMREVETLVRGAEITDNVRREIIKFHKMKRSDFSSADAYITAYQTQYNQLGLHKVEPHPFGAMFVMLYDLEEELDSVKFTYQAMKDTIPDSVTKDIFNSMCKKLIVEARDTPASSSSNPTASANSARKNNDNNQRGGGRGRGRGGKSRGGGSHNSQSDDKTDKDQKDQPRFKNGPPKGKSLDEWAEQQRNKQPQYVNGGECAHCGIEGHPAKTCYHLMEDIVFDGWRPNKNVWCYAFAKRSSTNNDKGKAGVARANTARSTDDMWMLDSGASKTITGHREDFYEYSKYKPGEEPYSYTNANGDVQHAIAYGKAPIQIKTSTGKVRTILVNAYHDKTTRDRLLSTNALEADHGIFHDPITPTLVRANREEVGLVKKVSGLPWIDGPLYHGVKSEAEDEMKIKTKAHTLIQNTYFYEPNSGSDPDTEEEELDRINKSVSTYEIHRRLGHVGRPHIKASLTDAVLLDEDDQLELYDFDCEACQLGKAKKQISRDKQQRVEKPGMKFHADSQSMNPPGPRGEKYWVPIVDDCTRYTEGPCFRSKDEIADYMIKFCKRQKLLRGRYPAIWRIDGGTEFHKFQTWAENEGMIFELTPAYTPEPNGVAERMGGYINQTQRTMNMDAKLPDMLWPFRVDTAIYIHNRLINPKTGKTPILTWQEGLGLGETKVNLKHLRAWGSIVFTYIPKETRVQSEKSRPRAFRGHLIGYEGENGHIFKVWNPVTKEIVRSRDVTFPDKLDKNRDDDQKGGVTPASKPAPKDPDSDDDNAGALFEEGGPIAYAEKGKLPFEKPKVVIQPKLVPQVVITSRRPEPAVQAPAKPIIQQRQDSVGPNTPGRAWTMPPTPKVPSRIQEIEDQSPIRQPIFQKPKKQATQQPIQQITQQPKQQANQQASHQFSQQSLHQRPTLQPKAHETIRRYMDQLNMEVSVLPPAPPQPRKQATKPLVLETIPESPITILQSIERDDSEDEFHPITHPDKEQELTTPAANRLISQQHTPTSQDGSERQVQRATHDVEDPTPQAVARSPYHLPGAFREETPHETPRAALSQPHEEISHNVTPTVEVEPKQIPIEPDRPMIDHDQTTSEEERAPIEHEPNTMTREPSVITISTDDSATDTGSVPPEQFIPRRSSRTRRSPERYGFPSNPNPNPPPNPPRPREPKRIRVRPDVPQGNNSASEGSGQEQEDTQRGRLAASKVVAKQSTPFIYNGKPLHVKDVDIPQSYKQAQKSRFADRWQAAMESQIDDLYAKGTFDIVRKPPGITPLPSQWVYDLKVTKDNEVYGFKARWVVCGNFQMKKEDSVFYAPVVQNTLVKIVFTIIAQRGYKWRQFDAIAAYLNASRQDHEIVYAIQPLGFEYQEPDIGIKGWVCQLKQALYGLRDSAALWNKELDTRLNKIGFYALDDDPCVYMKEHNGSTWFLLVHVDDFIAAAPTDKEVEQIFQEVKQQFEIKDIGEPSRFLGSAVSRDYNKRTITMSQKAYSLEALRLAEMQAYSPLPIPLSPGRKWDTKNEDPEILLLGKLNWLAVETRPDIKFTVMKLQHRTTSPTINDMQAVRAAYRYLKATIELCVTLGKQDAKSTEGAVWFFGGAPILWYSKKQSIMTPSSTAAEWCALDRPARDAQWFAKIAKALSLPGAEHPIVILTDNINTQLLMAKKACKNSTRWLDMKWFFVKDAIFQNKIDLRRIDTKNNVADGFTKPLDSEAHEKFIQMLGLH